MKTFKTYLNTKVLKFLPRLSGNPCPSSRISAPSFLHLWFTYICNMRNLTNKRMLSKYITYLTKRFYKFSHYYTYLKYTTRNILLSWNNLKSHIQFNLHISKSQWHLIITIMYIIYTYITVQLMHNFNNR